MKKLNNQGFTLVELLAVIVVLALLMVVATSSIGGALNNAKKNTLKTEAQKMLTASYSDLKSSFMLSNNLNNISGKTYATTATGTVIVEYKDGDYTGYFEVATNKITKYCVTDPTNTKMSVHHTFTGTESLAVDQSDKASSPKISDSSVYHDGGTNLCSIVETASGSGKYKLNLPA